MVKQAEIARDSALLELKSEGQKNHQRIQALEQKLEKAIKENK